LHFLNALEISITTSRYEIATRKFYLWIGVGVLEAVVTGSLLTS